MLFNYPLLNPVEMATAVKKRTKELEERNKPLSLKKSDSLTGTIPDIFTESFIQTLEPYIEPYIEQKVKEELAREIPKQVSFYKSHIVWFIVLPVITALIVYFGMRKK
jgi:hypothetical protein